MFDKHFLPSTFYVHPFEILKHFQNILCTVYHLTQLFLLEILRAANNEPIITIEAPKRIDFAISPCVRMPPSAINGLRAALLHKLSAASCQPPVPNPVLFW